MPVIRTEADRQAVARQYADLRDWQKAHKIATMKVLQDRRDALLILERYCMPAYHQHIASRVTVVFENRKAKANALANNASSNYQKAFKKTGQGAKANRGVTGTVHRPKAKASAHVASMLDSLSEGANA